MSKKSKKHQNKRQAKAKPKPTPKASPAAPKASSQPSKSRKATLGGPGLLPFDKRNYQLLIMGIAVLIFGYVLLGMEDFVDANEFSVSLYIAPWVIVLGYLEIIYAILWRPKKAEFAGTHPPQQATGGPNTPQQPNKADKKGPKEDSSEDNSVI